MTDAERLKQFQDRGRAILLQMRAALGAARKTDKKVDDDVWENGLLIALTSMLAGQGLRLGLTPEQNATNLRQMCEVMISMQNGGKPG
jgi:hypothetical protein